MRFDRFGLIPAYHFFPNQPKDLRVRFWFDHGQNTETAPAEIEIRPRRTWLGLLWNPQTIVPDLTWKITDQLIRVSGTVERRKVLHSFPYRVLCHCVQNLCDDNDAQMAQFQVVGRIPGEKESMQDVILFVSDQFPIDAESSPPQ